MKYFKKEDEEMEALLKKLLSSIVVRSFNYDFSYKGIKEPCLNNKIIVKDLYLNDDAVDKLVKFTYAFTTTINKNVDTMFLDCKHYFAKSNSGCIAVIIEIPIYQPIECDCNYIALVSDCNGNQFVYTNEYHQLGDEFKLYKWENWTRKSCNSKNIKSLAMFLEFINFKLV